MKSRETVPPLLSKNCLKHQQTYRYLGLAITATVLTVGPALQAVATCTAFCLAASLFFALRIDAERAQRFALPFWSVGEGKRVPEFN